MATQPGKDEQDSKKEEPGVRRQPANGQEFVRRKSAFDRQLEICARTVRFVPSPPTPEGNSAPLSSRTASENSAPPRMLEHETQTAFLKRLIAYVDGEASRQLHDRLADADHNSKRIGRAMFVTVVLFILSLAGLGYCADVLPQIFSNPTHILTKSLSILVLASLICQLEFLGYLLWHRLAVCRLQKECRRRILLLVEPQLKVLLTRSPSADISQESRSTPVGAPSSRLQDRPQD